MMPRTVRAAGGRCCARRMRGAAPTAKPLPSAVRLEMLMLGPPFMARPLPCRLGVNGSIGIAIGARVGWGGGQRLGRKRMSRPSPIWTELDWERDGKRVGTLTLPYSVTRSAYGVIAIPACVIKNGP